MIKSIKRLLSIDSTAVVFNKSEKVLDNGTTIYFATIRRRHPVVPGK
jgi:hypothetical protein